MMLHDMHSIFKKIAGLMSGDMVTEWWEEIVGLVWGMGCGVWSR